MKLTKLAFSVAVGLSLVGCGAGDAPYDEVVKPKEQVKKDVFDTNKVYMYMPSMSKAPRYAVAMAPFMQGDEQLVRLNFSEDGLQVRAINSDVVSQAQLNNGDFGRWNDSVNDNAPVLTIPGDYADYRCRLDDYDECTNKEEENKDADVEWHDKQFFTPDFASLENISASWNDLSRSSQCYSPVGSARLTEDPTKGWKGYEVSADGSIFIEVEQEYTVKKSWGCLINGLIAADFNFTELSFTVAHTYSIVPIENLTSKDYEPILYSVNDEDTFGFFTSEVERPTAANIDGAVGNKHQYLNRFNPNLAFVDYHLSDSFNNNESTRFFKQITFDVMNRINPQLKAAGVPQVNLVEPSGKHSGDLRYNVINLIDEPLANGLAGYGPSAANPVTGEIVHAHINQYSGVLEAGANFYWDTISSTYNRGGTTQKPTVNTDTIDSQASNNKPSYNSNNLALASDDINIAKSVGEVVTEQSIPNTQYLDKELLKLQDEVHTESLELVLEEIARLDNLNEDDLTNEQRIKRDDLEKRVWAENNMFPAASLWTSTTAKALPTGIAGHNIDYTDASLWVNGVVAEEFSGVATDKPAQLKKWADLSNANQVKIGRILAGISYAKTLVHELGHNLGLRHNFKGSIDASNFFSQQQAKENGLIHVPAYSSIMDYNPSILDALPVFGPYDLAALQFGYKREVAVLDAKTKAITGVRSVKAYDEKLLKEYLDINASVSQELNDGVVAALAADLEAEATADSTSEVKPYKFCTDGNVSGNSDCNRHDEGRNHNEINKFAIQRYRDFYEIRNTRNNREEYTEYNLRGYAVAREREFSAMRDNLEFLSRAWGGDLAQVNNQLLFANHNLAAELNWPADNWTTRCVTPEVSSFWNGETPEKDAFLWDIYCGVPSAVARTQEFFIETIAQPDHTCEIKNSSGEVRYSLLTDLMNGKYDGERTDTSSMSAAPEFAMGEVPTSCFNDTLTAALAIDNYEVLSEAGRFLNSGRAPVRNPNHKYSSDRDYLGTWVDKLVAMGQLVERNTSMPISARQSMALADLFDFQDSPTGIVQYPAFNMLLKDMVLQGKPFYAAKFRNAQGEEVAPQGDYPGQWSWDSNIEELPLYSGCLSWCYGLAPKGENNLIEALLQQVMIESRDSSLAGRDQAEALARYVSIRVNDNSTYTDAVYWDYKGKRYAATPENGLAYEIIVSLEELAFMQSVPNVADVTQADADKLRAFKYVDYRPFYFGTEEEKAELIAKIEGYKAALPMLPVTW
ncbi:zinc-dependent metalloprotease [Motilimonas sp. 1_MG-2023]|uniref:zinc-dependent metalloprotease n=1 Tax=Motilimonas TaxID=1914248 RepID=UPI0026E2F351|nr:zinc-dependent metalloprotease [Motilimonas sp. 1_MG-2023]MDO6527193.1 zinc-dependent metalloprotease [Motilimonas sp. 1_MG-2023]